MKKSYIAPETEVLNLVTMGYFMAGQTVNVGTGSGPISQNPDDNTDEEGSAAKHFTYAEENWGRVGGWGWDD